jgi:hypothetical protein
VSAGDGRGGFPGEGWRANRRGGKPWASFLLCGQARPAPVCQAQCQAQCQSQPSATSLSQRLSPGVSLQASRLQTTRRAPVVLGADLVFCNAMT